MLEYCSVVHLSLQVVAVRPVELMSLPTEFLLLLFLNPKVVDCSTRSVSPQATASTRSVHSYRPNQKIGLTTSGEGKLLAMLTRTVPGQQGPTAWPRQAQRRITDGRRRQPRRDGMVGVEVIRCNY